MSRYTHDLSQTVEPGGLFFGVVVPNVAATRTAAPGNVFATELRMTSGRALNELKYQLSGNKIGTSDPEANRNTRGQFGIAIPELSVTGLSLAGTTQGFNIQ